MKYLYQLPVPDFDNYGRPYPATSRNEFRLRVLECAGGYTLLPGVAAGAWEDETGKLWEDHSKLWQFAASEDSAQAIVATFFRLFPDQKCAMLAKLGTTEFHYNQRR